MRPGTGPTGRRRPSNKKMKADSLTLKFCNKMSELEELGRKVVDYCHCLGLPKKVVFQIKLSMEEIFVNIISYGFSDNNEHFIQVEVIHDNGTLTMKFVDDGVPFNPLLEAEEPDLNSPLEDRKAGGLGLHLTKCLMNEIKYDRRENKNVLIMKKVLEDPISDAC